MEVLHGLHAPFREYQADHYSGGSLVVGALAAVPFAVLGPTVFALKLVPLAFALAIFVVAGWFVRRAFGARAAVLALLLVLGAPPATAQLSLLAMGYHTETPLFGLVVIAGLAAYLARDDRPRRIVFGAGLVAGAGMWFAYVTASFVLAALLAWIAVERGQLRRRDLVLFGAGVAVVGVPLLLYTWPFGVETRVTSLAGVLAYDESPLMRLAKFPARVVKILAMGVPLSAGFPDMGFVPGPLLSAVYAAAAAVLVVPLCLAHLRRRAAAPALIALVLCPAIVVAVYAATPLRIARVHPFESYRYLAPLHMCGLLLAAVAASRVRAGPLTVALMFALGLAGQAGVAFQEPAAHALRYRGYSYEMLGLLWQLRAAPNATGGAELRAMFERFGEDARPALYRGAAGTVPQQTRMHEFSSFPAFIVEIPPRYRGYFFEAWGELHARDPRLGPLTAAMTGLAPSEKALVCAGFEKWRAIGETREGWSRLRARTLASDEPCRGTPSALMALGYLLAAYPFHDEGCAWLARVRTDRDPDELRWIYRGVGRGAQDLGLPWRPGCGLSDVPAAHLDDFYRGVGREMGEYSAEDDLQLEDMLRALPASARRAADAGVADARRWTERAIVP
jgi:hypothetical protein